MSLMTLCTTLLIGVLLLVVINRVLKHPNHPPLPPGPPADPIIGHLRIMPTKDSHEFFFKMGQKYGKVSALQIPGSTIIVLNSTKAAVDLLDRRSAIYSDRPITHVMRIMGWEKNIGFMPYGKDFIKHRKLMHDYLHPNICLSYQRYQEIEAQNLVRNLQDAPEKFEEHLSRFSTAIILRIVHGHEIATNDDPYIKIMKDAGYCINNCAMPGSNSVDFMPILQYFPSWFPGTQPATHARAWKHMVQTMYDVPYNNVKEQLNNGTALESFLSKHIEGINQEGGKYPYDVMDIKGAASMIYIAGADTTWSTLLIFMLALVFYPDVQTKVQNELDRVVGSNRLPQFEDRKNLPYLECVVQEAYRWHNAIPTGVAHKSMEDDIYEGMFIPKGSVIIANTRGMSLDEDIYQNSHAFDPDRYLRGEPYPVAHFGFGRRICPGRHLADANVWIAIASILSIFTISPIVDVNGQKILPKEDFESGITSHPKPFKCSISPRTKIA